MEAYWNKLSMERPPTTTWRCPADEFDSNGFLVTIEKVIQDIDSQVILHTEAALLSRLIYRMKSKLRSDKGFKNMEKVNRALLSYLKVDLEKEYIYLRDNIECTENIQILPSRQMLQYILVRMQGFAKLMCRIETVAERAANFFRARITMGQAWNLSIVAYAVISRIWFLARYFSKKCCNWYNIMYKYHDKLKMIGVSWLPEKYCLPEDLKTFLYVPWIDQHPKRISQDDDWSDKIFNLMQIHQNAGKHLNLEVHGTRETFPLSPTSPVVKSFGIGSSTEECVSFKIKTQNKIHSSLVSLDDMGRRVSRDAFTVDLAKQRTKSQYLKKRKIVGTEDEKEVLDVSSKKGTNDLKKRRRGIRGGTMCTT